MPRRLDRLPLGANQKYGITKVCYIIPGGETGHQSISHGINTIKENYGDDDHLVLVHDGNRPFVSQEIITNSIETAQSKGGAVGIIPCVEAMFTSADSKTSDVSISRENAYRTQTPHVFPLSKLLWAHEQAKEKNLEQVAVCSLLYDLGEKIHFYPGSEKNFKITTRDDLHLFTLLINDQGDSAYAQ